MLLKPVFSLRGDTAGTTSFHFVPSRYQIPPYNVPSAVSGDELGNVHLWDLDARRILATYKSSSTGKNVHEEPHFPVLNVKTIRGLERVLCQNSRGHVSLIDFSTLQPIVSLKTASFGFCRGEIVGGMGNFSFYQGKETESRKKPDFGGEDDGFCIHSQSTNVVEHVSQEEHESALSEGNSFMFLLPVGSGGKLGAYDMLRTKEGPLDSTYERGSFHIGEGGSFGAQKPQIEIPPPCLNGVVSRTGSVNTVSAAPSLGETMVLVGYEACMFCFMDLRYPSKGPVTKPFWLYHEDAGHQRFSGDVLNACVLQGRRAWSGTALGNLFSLSFDERGDIFKTSKICPPDFSCTSNSRETSNASKQKTSRFDGYRPADFSGKLRGVSALSVRGDGLHLVAGYWDHCLRLFDINPTSSLDLRLEAEIDYHQRSVTCVQFCPETGVFVSSCRQSNAIPVWDVLGA